MGVDDFSPDMEKVSAIPKIKDLGLPEDAEVRFQPLALPCDSADLLLCSTDGHQLRMVRSSRSSGTSRGLTTCLFLFRGAFDSSTHEHLPRTSYDVTIDETSNKPGEQAFEKMIAGLYLGEIFRLVMCEMIDEGRSFELLSVASY